MSALQFWTLNVIAFLLGGLMLTNFILEQKNLSLQSTLADLQAEETETDFYRSTVRNLISDASREANRDARLKQMLQQRGYLVP
jgi:hypothetical protein